MFTSVYPYHPRVGFAPNEHFSNQKEEVVRDKKDISFGHKTVLAPRLQDFEYAQLLLMFLINSRR